jgi:hypothetical protein
MSQPVKAVLDHLQGCLPHAATIVAYVRTEAGNHVLIESSNVEAADLVAAKDKIDEALKTMWRGE